MMITYTKFYDNNIDQSEDKTKICPKTVKIPVVKGLIKHKLINFQCLIKLPPKIVHLYISIHFSLAVHQQSKINTRSWSKYLFSCSKRNLFFEIDKAYWTETLPKFYD